MKTSLIMDRLFPARKPQNAATISARLDATRTALDEARQRQAAAEAASKAAMVSADRAAFLAAKAEGEDAEFAAGVASGEIEALSTALDAAVKAERAAERAALVASFVERRRAVDDRLEREYRAAAETMGAILSEVATLARDLREAGAEDEFDKLPEIGRWLPMRDEAVGNVSRFLGDALAGRPAVSETPKEVEVREYRAERKRKQAADAGARRVRDEAEAEAGRAAREAERQAEAERGPYYGGGWRDVLDAAR